MSLAMLCCSCWMREFSSSCSCHSLRSLNRGLPKYFSACSSPPRAVRIWSILWESSACTISLFTLRESTLACMRKSLACSMFSRMVQRVLRSEPMPWARIICTSCSMSLSEMNSPPTTATVLSITPLYLWACAPGMNAASSRAIVTRVFFILRRLQNLFCPGLQ